MKRKIIRTLLILTLPMWLPIACIWDRFAFWAMSIIIDG